MPSFACYSSTYSTIANKLAHKNRGSVLKLKEKTTFMLKLCLYYNSLALYVSRGKKPEISFLCTGRSSYATETQAGFTYKNVDPQQKKNEGILKIFNGLVQFYFCDIRARKFAERNA